MAVGEIVIRILMIMQGVALAQYCGDTCCTGYYRDELNGNCTECTIGYWGTNCSKPCPKPLFGRECMSQCHCDEQQFCHHAKGCINDSGTHLNTTSQAHASRSPSSNITAINNRQNQEYPGSSTAANNIAYIKENKILKTSIVPLACLCGILAVAYLSVHVYGRTYQKRNISERGSQENVYENHDAIEMQEL